MNMIGISNEKISDKEIKEFELKLKTTLPEEYKSFLIKCNGGYPQEPVFKISEEKGYSLINEFYGIKTNIDRKGIDLEEIFGFLDGEIPKGFIPIADDPAGNQILLGINSKYRGKVYFWYHDVLRVEDMDNMFLLDDHFDNFLNNLQSEEFLDEIEC